MASCQSGKEGNCPLSPILFTPEEALMSRATRIMIRRNLMSLLEKEPMDDITVRMICELSGVSRQTFYNNYYCLMSAFEDAFEEDVFGSESAQTDIRWCEIGMEKVLFYCYEHRREVLHVYNSKHCDELLIFIERLTRRMIESGIEECMKASGIACSERDVDFIKYFYLIIFMGMTRTYLKSGIKESPYFLLSRSGVMLEHSAARSLMKLHELEQKDASDADVCNALQSEPIVKLFDRDLKM